MVRGMVCIHCSRSRALVAVGMPEKLLCQAGWEVNAVRCEGDFLWRPRGEDVCPDFERDGVGRHR